MRIKATFGIVLACVGAVLCPTAARAAIQCNVEVNGGTFKNPVGVGFGWWEGAKVLIASLSAKPGSIRSAEAFAGEAVIWSPQAGNPWVFQTAGIVPNEAFAVRFRGTLNGTTPGGEFGVAVSDINIECDSLNTSTKLFRAPSWSDAEDAAEYPENGGSATAPQGMIMVAGEDWAEIDIRGHFKRSGTMALEVDPVGIAVFEIADQNFKPLAAFAGDVETHREILSQQSVTAGSPGSGPWTYYIRPRRNVAAVRNGSIGIAAVFTPGNPAISSPPAGGSPRGRQAEPVDYSRAEDDVLVSTGNLTAIVNDTTQHRDDYVIVSTPGNWRPYTDLTITWNGNRPVSLGLVTPPANGQTGDISFDPTGSNPITLQPAQPVTTRMYGNIASKVIDDCVVNLDRDTRTMAAPGRTLLQVPITVASISLQATINSTPPFTPRLLPINNQPNPATVSFPAPVVNYVLPTDNTLLTNPFPQWLFPDSSPPATPPQTLVLIEDGSQVAISATTAPPNLPITFRAVRDPGDAAGLGTGVPRIIPGAPNGATVVLDQHGSFLVLAFLDNKYENGSRDPGEVGVMLPLILVDAQHTGDASAFNQALAHIRSGGGGDYWEVVGGAGTNVLGGPGAGEAGAELNATAMLYGGGPAGIRGLDHVHLGWVQNITQQLACTGTYAPVPGVTPPTTPVKSWLYVSNSPNIGDYQPPGTAASPITQFPLADGERLSKWNAASGPWRPTLYDNYGLSTSTNYTAGFGQQRIVAGQDRPSLGFESAWRYPQFSATYTMPSRPALQSINVDFELTAYLSGWTDQAPLTYSAFGRVPWKFSATVDLTQSPPATSFILGKTAPPFAQPATPLNVFPPGGECCLPAANDCFGRVFGYR